MQYKISVIYSTPLYTNNYLLESETGAILIDASATVNAVKQVLKDKPLLGIFLTHSHFDHAVNCGNLQKEFGCTCFMSKKCFEEIKDHKKAFYGDRAFSCDLNLDKVKFVQDGEKINVGEFEARCIETNGHTDDSISFLVGENLFVGDVIFADGYGRTDLKGGSEQELIKSINKLLKFENKNIMPGHGEGTTTSWQKSVWSGDVYI